MEGWLLLFSTLLQLLNCYTCLCAQYWNYKNIKAFTCHTAWHLNNNTAQTQKNNIIHIFFLLRRSASFYAVLNCNLWDHVDVNLWKWGLILHLISVIHAADQLRTDNSLAFCAIINARIDLIFLDQFRNLRLMFSMTDDLMG